MTFWSVLAYEISSGKMLWHCVVMTPMLVSLMNRADGTSLVITRIFVHVVLV